ncbi:MAG: hypothetical protein CL779_00920 [Chloroflexi bacterium]|nr:hypothetical protein [Chloroflexota bacterium]|tara:strand:- start:774 stop:1067 length:294 start_codon:yes stop_codon:yes gene_type:complete
MFTKSFVITIRIPNSTSLKYKRSVVKSVIGKTQNKFNVSIGEINYLNELNMSSVGFAIISNERKHIFEKEREIILFIELELLGKAEIIEIVNDENKI